VAAKNLLKAKNLRFIECNMDDAEVRRAFEFAYPNVRGMPQIFIEDQRVGGFLGLQEALKQIALDKKANNARELGLDYEPWGKKPNVNFGN